MTELERMLKNTLTALERGMTATQEAQQKTLETHRQAISRLERSFNQLQAEQTESARHLQRLSDIHANLEPLLSRLSALLNSK